MTCVWLLLLQVVCSFGMLAYHGSLARLVFL
jgi:hypothetical protein